MGVSVHFGVSDEYFVMISSAISEETPPTPWRRPERFLLMVNQWSSSERISWCYPLADALLSQSALLMNSLGLVSACAGLDYEWTPKRMNSHYSVLIIFHAPVRTASTRAFTRSSFMLGLSPSSNCGGSSAAVQIIAAFAIYLSFFCSYQVLLNTYLFYHQAVFSSWIICRLFITILRCNC